MDQKSTHIFGIPFPSWRREILLFGWVEEGAGKTIP